MNIQKLPDFLLIRYGNALDDFMTYLINQEKSNTVMYKLCRVLCLSIDRELETRMP